MLKTITVKNNWKDGIKGLSIPLLLLYFTTTVLTTHAQTIAVNKINKAILFQEMASKPQFKYHMVCIFTNKCIGTQSMFARIKLLEENKITNTNISLCCSSKEKDAKITKKLVQESGTGIDHVFMIDKKMYREKLTDDRKKGFLFRNDICKECAIHEIGVPYTILFDQNGTIINYGYLGREEILETVRN